MQSNVCKIEKGTKDLAAILKESEKVAVYNELGHKETLQLRLICEEIDGMLPEILGDFDGKIWIEFEEGVCKVKLSIRYAEFTADKKEELLGLAKNKKNAAAEGITGKIHSVLEDVFLDDENRKMVNLAPGSYHMATGMVDYTYLWTLEEYKVQVKEEKEAWDQLEKSVLAAASDDIIVGVKGRQADIIIVKKFA